MLDPIIAQSKMFWPDFYIPDAMSYDIETFVKYGIFGGMRMRTGKVFGLRMSDKYPLDTDRLRRLLQNNTVLTFNGMNFDAPLTFLALDGASMAEIKSAADHIIVSGVKWWEVEREIGVTIPKWFKQRHIDLMEPNPAVRQSLKTLNGRLHGIWMRDMPIAHDAVDLSEEEKRLLDEYWVNDLNATGLLAHNLSDSLQLREKIGEEIGVDLRSKSDTQMGYAIIRKRVEDLRGERLQKSQAKVGQSFNYTPPDHIRFQDAGMTSLLDRIKEHTFTTKSDGKVELPKWLLKPIELYGANYKMGIGGLHSMEANRSLVPVLGQVMQDHDVNSMYPSLILSQGLYPEAMGRDFLKVYQGIYRDRLAAKASKNKIVDKSLKLSLNGAFGLLGNRWSPLYAPNLLIAVTITGQLSLLMLIEMFELAGLKVVSANTDGIVTFTDRHNTAPVENGRVGPSKLLSVIEEWERLTGMTMESAEYAAIYNQSVNSYIALKPDGTHKRKGPLGNPWSSDPSENDIRSQMMKNPQMTICSDAVLAYLKHNIPVEQTIRECMDVREFLTVVNATGGATWGPGEPIYETVERLDGKGKTVRSEALVGYEGEEYLGKVVRYYWSTKGNPIIKVKGHNVTGNRPKVSKTEGSRPMMTLPDDLSVPDDLDFQRYIDEAYAILRDIGYSETTLWESVLALAIQQKVA